MLIKEEPHQIAYLLMKNIEESSGGGKSKENGLEGRKRQDWKSNGSWQKNKRGDSKMESDDNPEIPDEGRHQTSPVSLRGTYHDKDNSPSDK